jgi:hypothetical protein
MKQNGGAASLTKRDQEAVREQLHRLLSSARFHSSRRCQALLQYVVEESLRGHADALKERTIGVEVFERDPAYDTNTDPVVRMAAGEVRKKLAQYYYEVPHQEQIRIELPIGSYVPEFHTQETAPIVAEVEAVSHVETDIAGISEGANTPHATLASPIPKRHRRLWWVVGFTVLFAASAFALHMWMAKDAFEQFWAPVINSSNPVLLCMGQLRATRVQLDPNASRNPFSDPMKLGADGEYPKSLPVAVLADSMTLANFAGLFRADKKAFTMLGEASTSFDDLQKGPVLLLGAYNNDWTMRLTSKMRYQFAMDSENNAWWITDEEKPGTKIGFLKVDANLPYTDDYAIVVRTFDPQTREPTIIVAGVAPAGTHAAGEFLTDPIYLNEFAKTAPRNWQQRNMELLIHTNVIDGAAGPPHVVGSSFW